MKLSKKILSRRIQECAFDDYTPYATNLCAHFWKTLGALGVLLVVGICLPIIWPLGKMAEYLARRKTRKIAQLRKIAEGMTADDIIQMFLKRGYISMRSIRDFFRYDVYNSDEKWARIVQHWDWYNKMNELEEAFDKITADTSFSTSTIRQTFATYLSYLYWLVASVVMMYGVVLAMCIGGSGITIFEVYFWFILLGLIMCGAILWIAITGYMTYIRPYSRYYGQKLEDDVPISYLKAVKDRICPLIEWVD
jgi:hypothetical protein